MWRWSIRGIAEKFTLSGRAERIRCPVLVVHGEREGGVPREQAEKVVQGSKGEAAFHSAPAGNHVCHTVHRSVYALVSDWPADRLGSGA
ncbi:MAG: alpha/beta hydrolase family protein [Nitrospinota bacterium]